VPILVDGHNLIGRLPMLSLQDPDDEEKLVRLLLSYQARVGKRITVVFDHGPGAGLGRIPSSGGVEVLFAARGSTADAVIARRVRRSADAKGGLVITSDRQLADTVKGLGARVQSSDDFSGKLSSGDDEAPDWRETPPSSEEIHEWLTMFENRD